MHRLEKIADGIFIIAMIGMVIICALITYTHFYSGPIRRWLKNLFENPHPVSAQNLFDLLVGETALDQVCGSNFARENGSLGRE